MNPWEEIHHLITEEGLKCEVEKHKFDFVKQICMLFPNGKKLIRMDFLKQDNL